MDRVLAFPQPFPEETIHSLVARYHRLVGNESYRLTSQELFDCYSRTSGSVFPCCLEALSRRLYGLYSVDNLIEHRTLFPLYRPFFSEPQRNFASSAMAGSSGVGLKMGLGITASGFLRYESHRFCEACLARDLKVCGQPYWHRIHLAPGVLVCPHHGLALMSTLSTGRSDWRSLRLPGESPAVPVLVGEYVDALQIIAQLQFWGLHHPDLVTGLIEGDFLKQRMVEMDFLHAGRFREKSLRDYLRFRFCLVPQEREYESLTRNADWVMDMLRRRERLHQPLRFYFLCYLLGVSCQELVCFNAVSSHNDSLVLLPTLTHTKASDKEKAFYRQKFLQNLHIKQVKERPGYSWLFRNDHQWLRSYTSSHIAERSSKPRRDWSARDEQLSTQLLSARNSIVFAEGKPNKVTKSALCRAVAQHYDFLRMPHKFPRSIQILDRIVETEHDFQIRKIRWVIQSPGFSRTCSVSVLWRLAGIRIKRVSDFELERLLSEMLSS